MLYLVIPFYRTLFCWWKGKFLLVESVFEDTKTRSGFVTKETDAKRICQRHGKFICSELVKGHGHGKKRTRQGSQFTTANGSQSDLSM
jgi:hypothetical protein